MAKNDSIVVIIPAYEPSANFIDYAKKLLKAKIHKLVVVNDGSGEKYSHIFESLKALDGCEVISYNENAGKGLALKTALEYCRVTFDDSKTFVTADCDGQHLVCDVINVAKAAKEFGDSFVLGVRDFSQPNVPLRSKKGNISTRRIFKLLYGVRISDTQTGLRAFPYSMLSELIAIKGIRFEYEMNQLVILQKKNIPIREVPIVTVYDEKPDDVEKVSHYKTFKDSFRVFKVLITNLSLFMFSSVISAFVEVLALFFGLKYLPGNGLWFFDIAMCSQFIARLSSSILNFIFNYKLVFNGQSKKSIFKYYLLWIFLFACSLLYASGWSRVFPENEFLITFMTGVCTVIMSLLSYQIQTRWVFAKSKRKDGRFFGLYSRGVRFLYNIFTKSYTSMIAKDPCGCVYVCRHLNMHGPLTFESKVGFDVHMMTFSVFCTFKECFRHLRDYNFGTLKHMNKFNSTILAFISATFLVPLIHSLEAIPVYRKNAHSIVTFRRAMQYLRIHENVVVFPDIKYTATENEETDIYDGFLFLEKLYYKEFNKHLRFIPVIIDDEKKTIIEKPPIRFKNGDYKKQIETIKEKIKIATGCVHLNKDDDDDECLSEAIIADIDIKNNNENTRSLSIKDIAMETAVTADLSEKVVNNDASKTVDLISIQKDEKSN